jgi:AcrR family transcriptional regulator
MAQLARATPPTTTPHDAVTEPVARILDAAEACIRAYGFAGASVRAIAESAGVSKSLVLYHFGSKEQLYVQVQTRVYERLATSIRAAVARSGGDLVQRGMVALDALIGELRANNDLATQTLLGARALSSERLRHDVDALRRKLRRLLHDTMRDVLGDDALLPFDQETAADLLFAVLAGIGMEAAFEDTPERVDRMLDAVRTLVHVALGHPMAGGRTHG